MTRFDEIKADNPIIRNVQSKMYKSNNNWICLITGDTGSGKSWSALSIASRIDPDFNMEKVVLEPLEFMKNLADSNYGQGDCIVFDEAGAGMGSKDHMTKENKVIDKVIQTFRRQNISVILTVPSKANLDRALRRMVDTEIETAGIEYETSRNVLKWFEIDYNQRMDKIYRHYPKKKLDNGGTKKVKRLRLKKPDDDLLDAYEKKRDNFQERKNNEFYNELLDEDESSESSYKYDHSCYQCGYDWEGRAESPAQCPSCWSRNWDESDNDDKQKATV